MPTKYIYLGVVLAALGLTAWGCFGLTQHLIMAIDHYGDAGAAAQQTLAILNKPKYDTLAEVDATLLQGRLTIDAVNKVAIHEQHQLSTFDGYAARLVTDIDGLSHHADSTLASASQTAQAASRAIGTLNTTIGAAQPLLASSNALIQTANKTVGDYDFFATDPHVREFITHLDSTMGHIDGTTADVQYKAHILLHPDKVKLTLGSAIEGSLLWFKSYAPIPPIF
jgi:hypothetical protein